ncbi:hypothetical protein P7K49_017940 [Saguinus oedipus]|uniref:Small ribosomal subunit protein eS4 central region domain-containing protein n=1 Tax=Saguinus oedipus TaxID=9490 RepID=A0ABQ9V3Y4_SAGOE|nr:hypothetical protein P7K49_017940 [Saguinus oedipus]
MAHGPKKHLKKVAAPKHWMLEQKPGCFAVHHITPEEAKYKLCKMRKIFVGTKGIPHLVTHDAHTNCYPDPLIKVNDTIQIDLETGNIIHQVRHW